MSKTTTLLLDWIVKTTVTVEKGLIIYDILFITFWPQHTRELCLSVVNVRFGPLHYISGKLATRIGASGSTWGTGVTKSWPVNRPAQSVQRTSSASMSESSTVTGSWWHKNPRHWKPMPSPWFMEPDNTEEFSSLALGSIIQMSNVKINVVKGSTLQLSLPWLPSDLSGHHTQAWQCTFHLQDSSCTGSGSHHPESESDSKVKEHFHELSMTMTMTQINSEQCFSDYFSKL